MTTDLCPICGEGKVTPSVRTVEYEYNGVVAYLPTHYMQCDTCTSDFVGIEESRKNKKILDDFKNNFVK